jgi:hypothetical protein
MRPAVLGSAVLAVAVGLGAAVAFAGDAPLAPKSLTLQPLAAGAAISYDGVTWQDAIAGYQRDGLPLLRPTRVRGPARIDVVAGTWVLIGPGEVVEVSWEPAVRGWRFVALVGEPAVHFANGTQMLTGTFTLTSVGDLYRHASGYSPGRVLGLTGLPEVSGFRPFEDDVR